MGLLFTMNIFEFEEVFQTSSKLDRCDGSVDVPYLTIHSSGTHLQL